MAEDPSLKPGPLQHLSMQSPTKIETEAPTETSASLNLLNSVSAEFKLAQADRDPKLNFAEPFAPETEKLTEFPRGKYPRRAILNPIHRARWLPAAFIGVPGWALGLVALFYNPYFNPSIIAKSDIRAETREPIYEFQQGTIQELVVQNIGAAMAMKISIRIDNQLPSVAVHCAGEKHSIYDIPHNADPLTLREIYIDRLARDVAFTCQFSLDGAGPILADDVRIVVEEGRLPRDHVTDYNERRFKHPN